MRLPTARPNLRHRLPAVTNYLTQASGGLLEVRPASVRALRRTNPQVSEQGHGELIVELQTDGARLGTGRIARILGGDLAVHANADAVVPRFDFHAVPLAGALQALFGGDECVDAARAVLLAALIDDLDLV